MDRFKLRLPEILELNRYAVNRIYFFPRDDKGNLKFRVKAKQRTPTAKQEFFAFYDKYRLPKWRLEQLWAEHKEAKKKAIEDKKRQKKADQIAAAEKAKAAAGDRKRKRK